MRNFLSLRVLLFGLSGCLAIFVGFFLMNVEQAVAFVGHWGYWVIFIPFVLLLRELYLLLKGRCSHFCAGRENTCEPGFAVFWYNALKPNLLSACFILCASCVLWLSQPKQFKIVMDEPVLMGTSLQMHYEKETYSSTQLHKVEGVVYGSGIMLDKRPLFFPFVLSLMHDLTGYRPMQGIYVNGLLLVVFLSMVYCLGRRLCQPFGGYLAVGLCATLPLLAMNATGSGFDLLNLVMILGLGFALYAYLKEPTTGHMNVMLLVVVLLAQTRYESVLFVLPVGCAIIISWWRSREIHISRTMIFVPLMLVVYPLQRLIMDEFEDFWQLPEGLDRPFGLHFIGENLRYASDFLFAFNDMQPNSLLLSLLFVLSCIACASALIRRKQNLSLSTPAALSIMAVSSIILVNFLILMAYHWGQLSDPAATRLALPFILFQLFVVVLIVGWCRFRSTWQLLLCAVVAIYYFSVTRPACARTNFLNTTIRNAECDYLVKLANESQSRSNLIISDRSLASSIALQSSLGAEQALQQLDKLELHHRLHTYDNIYVVYLMLTKQAIEGLDSFDGISSLKERLESSFKMETVDEIKFNDAIYLRCARVTEVRLGCLLYTSDAADE